IEQALPLGKHLWGAVRRVDRRQGLPGPDDSNRGEQQHRGDQIKPRRQRAPSYSLLPVLLLYGTAAGPSLLPPCSTAAVVAHRPNTIRTPPSGVASMTRWPICPKNEGGPLMRPATTARYCFPSAM